jgi:uncharacterized protein YehS (DUF1456 family)
MNNKDVLRQLRYIFNFNDDQMMKLFALGGSQVDRSQLSNWLKKETDPDHEAVDDQTLAHFLNGFIIHKRGRKDDQPVIAEKRLNNNQIFRKLKIALTYRDSDILEVFSLTGFKVSKHEISALFRKPGQSQYRECKDQFLRNFLTGLKLKYRKG